jgi:hypothetical protein
MGIAPELEEEIEYLEQQSDRLRARALKLEKVERAARDLIVNGLRLVVAGDVQPVVWLDTKI